MSHNATYEASSPTSAAENDQKAARHDACSDKQAPVPAPSPHPSVKDMETNEVLASSAPRSAPSRPRGPSPEAQKPGKILVLDGDGALLLNLSSLPTLGWQRPPNLIHCVFVNGIYEASGGGRNATSANADLVALARGAGVPYAVWVETVEDFRQEVAAALDRDQLSFIAARVEPGVRPGLKSIDTQAVENKFLLARHIERTEGIQVLAPAYPRH